MSVENRLRQAGLKATPARKAMLRAFEEASDSLTAEALAELLLEQEVIVRQATLYRNLNAFVAAGLILPAPQDQETAAAYEMPKADHGHDLICYRCKKRESLKHCPLHQYENEVMTQTGFSIEGHALTLYGLCPECQEN